MRLSAPRLLSEENDLTDFDSGTPALDDWLKRRALPGQREGGARTYVACDGRRVVAYYCLAAGSVLRSEAPGRVRRNMPDPVPVIVLGRLAVDRRDQGQGIGRALVADAVRRTLQASGIAGIRAILVHAKDERAARFYLRCGFIASPFDPRVLMLSLKEAREALQP